MGSFASCEALRWSDVDLLSWVDAKRLDFQSISRISGYQDTDTDGYGIRYRSGGPGVGPADASGCRLAVCPHGHMGRPGVSQSTGGKSAFMSRRQRPTNRLFDIRSLAAKVHSDRQYFDPQRQEFLWIGYRTTIRSLALAARIREF